jgi:LysR family transcriptional regulator, benzoate and cis,cis-muconate-responsive activator of ben and cat genes
MTNKTRKTTRYARRRASLRPSGIGVAHNCPTSNFALHDEYFPLLSQYSLITVRYYPFGLRQLVSFAEIARLSSYRMAAESLQIAQPALTRQIQNLEEALEVQLFDRSTRRALLTPAGETLRQLLPRMFRQLDEIQSAVQRGSAPARIRIGDAGSVTSTILSPALRILRSEYPGIAIDLVQDTSQGYVDAVLSGELSCAFPFLPAENRELVSHRLDDQEVGVVLPADHRLAKKKAVLLSQLSDERWILFPRAANPLLYDEIIHCCRRAGFSPHVIEEATPRRRAVAFVSCGIGVTTITESLRYLVTEGTVYRRLIRPTPRVSSYLVARRDEARPEVRRLVLLCRQVAKTADAR